MNIFIDTEFSEGPDHLSLISLGMVTANGDTFYAEVVDHDDARACKWVQENVLTKLLRNGAESPKPQGKGLHFRHSGSHDSIAVRALDWVDALTFDPVFWGYFADYDWVLFCRLFGSMLNMPKGWPQLCLDVKQECLRLGISKNMFPDATNLHNALDDAFWHRDIYNLCLEVEARA